MNFSKKHKKLEQQKEASMIARTSVSARMMYWKKKNGLTCEELSYLINDGWSIYGKTVRDIVFKGGISHV